MPANKTEKLMTKTSSFGTPFGIMKNPEIAQTAPVAINV
jgi:hypothetical protein